MNNQRKFIIRLNSIEKVEQLLQETYDLATNQITQLQNEITKITNSTTLSDANLDEKEKYGKIINNYLISVQKAIDKTLDIAKFMGEVVKFNGDINKALNDSKNDKNSTLNLEKIRKSVFEITKGDTPENYEIKR